MNILFISWDGPQVSYLEGLFLPIFKGLRAHGIHFHVLQFTWADAASINQTQQAYEAAGISYQSIRIHRIPKAISAVLTAAWGGQQIRRAVRRHAIDVLMPRSVMPALATMLATGIGGLPIVFDADGLPIDERVEFDGQSPRSLRQRALRAVEVRILRRAKVVLTRTAKASEILIARSGLGADTAKFLVVGNGRDARMFHPFDPDVRSRMRARLGIGDNAPLLVYAGSTGPQYCLEAMLQLFKAVLERRPDARMMLLSRSAMQLMDLAAGLSIPTEAFVPIALRPTEVPEYLACADLGLALRTPSFSMQAVAPIKLGEYLLCGLPVVASTVIGNTRLIDGGTGYLMSEVDPASLRQAAAWFVDSVLPDREGFRARSNRLGMAHFSLDESVDDYLRALPTVASNDARAKSSLLHITYDGMLEPLGQSQVLAYLENLAANRAIHLLSFEKAQDWADVEARARVQSRIAASGIRWHPRRYHKRPAVLATSWDIGVGILSGLWLLLRHRLLIVHARSYVPAVMALVLQRLTPVRFVFDMRGFWADERLDGGLWPRGGRMYRVAKWFERKFLLSADHVVSLTEAALAEMQTFDYLQDRMPPVTVIPTCADLQRFRPIEGARDATGFTLGYVGSAGTWYLFDAVARAMRLLLDLRPDARFLLVNRGEHAYIAERLEAAGVPEERIEIRAADHSEVAGQMARMDASIFFIKPVFSKQASAPTRLGEFLGCGIPCLGNHGVGDMTGILEGERVGAAVTSFDDAALLAGLRQLLGLCDDPETQARCVDAAHRHFSLEQGVRSYAQVYAQVSAG